MFHAQCRELSLSTGAFSHSHAYVREISVDIYRTHIRIYGEYFIFIQVYFVA